MERRHVGRVGPVLTKRDATGETSSMWASHSDAASTGIVVTLTANVGQFRGSLSVWYVRGNNTYNMAPMVHVRCLLSGFSGAAIFDKILCRTVTFGQPAGMSNQQHEDSGRRGEKDIRRDSYG